MANIKYFDGKKTTDIAVNEETAQAYQEIRRMEWRQEKSKQRHEQLSLETLTDAGMQFVDEESDPENQLIEKEEQIEKDKRLIRLRKVIKLLDPNQQKIVKLKFYENKNETEIGRILGVTKQSAQDRLKVIYKKLKKLLEK